LADKDGQRTQRLVVQVRCELAHAAGHARVHVCRSGEGRPLTNPKKNLCLLLWAYRRCAVCRWPSL
jgi:hypothetical protein